MKTIKTFPTPNREPFIGCVVPVFNEGTHIGRFLTDLHACLSQISSRVEIVVVNDGSADDSAEQVLAVAQDCRVHYVEFTRNFGKEFAIQAGLDAIRADCAIIIDADYQHPLTLIPEMIARWRAGADMVYGVRTNRNGESLIKKIGSAMLYKLLSKQSHTVIPQDAGDFRLLDRKVVEVLKMLPERARFMKGLYAWGGFKAVAVPFDVGERCSGESKFNAVKLTKLAVTGITAFSTLPLRLVSMVGLAISAIATVMGCWIVFERLFMRQPIQGFATIAASVLFLSGVQLLALGIVGEYVGRIFDEVKQRPWYVVSRAVDCSVQSRAAIGSEPNRYQA